MAALPDVFGRKAFVQGIHPSVETILCLLAGGVMPEDIMADYADLGVDDMRACLIYAHAVMAEGSPDGESRANAEIGCLGEAIYREKIAGRVDDIPKGHFVVIDIKTGDYEIAKRDAVATRRLLERRPDAFTYAIRAGFTSAYRMRGPRLSKSP